MRPRTVATSPAAVAECHSATRFRMARSSAVIRAPATASNRLPEPEFGRPRAGRRASRLLTDSGAGEGRLCFPLTCGAERCGPAQGPAPGSAKMAHRLVWTIRIFGTSKRSSNCAPCNFPNRHCFALTERIFPQSTARAGAQDQGRPPLGPGYLARAVLGPCA